MISDKVDEPEDVDAKEDVVAGGDNLEKPMDWVKALDLPKAEGKKLVNAVQRIVKEELSKKKSIREQEESGSDIQGDDSSKASMLNGLRITKIFSQEELEQLSGKLSGKNIDSFKEMIRNAVAQSTKGSSKAATASKRISTITKNV